jgi:TRAP-type C4-dicarboxylate transport system permease small subunit
VYKKLVSITYVLNIVFQSFFNLALPMLLMAGGAWLLVRYASAPEWIYAPLIVFGALAGLYSMVKFILSAMAALDRLEREHKDSKANNGDKNEK